MLQEKFGFQGIGSQKPWRDLSYLLILLFNLSILGPTAYGGNVDHFSTSTLSPNALTSQTLYELH